MPEFPYGLDEAGYDRYLDARDELDSGDGGSCPECGKPLEIEDDTCPYCGTLL